MNRLNRWMTCAATFTLITTASWTQARDATAFCGTFVAGGDAELFNDATQVALMRKGTRTVLSMQNNYRGPIKDFAMVVPVPVVLMEEQVKTLPTTLFDKMDALSAPRLVEYYEQDPCYEPSRQDDFNFGGSDQGGAVSDMGSDPSEPEPPVVIEAEFEVGEYDIVLLSATEGTALESWLTTNSYSIPDGAGDIFEQYIQNDMYFFVAKVDPTKVTFGANNEAVLSPLRFAFDSPSFSLPIRLGMINSSGEQDLIVYILSQDGRHEVANYPNAFIPTNTILDKRVSSRFGDYYALLFEDTLKKNPGAIVTEYAWDASWCDPCPGEALYPEDFATLGADEFGDTMAGSDVFARWTLTRLHARYGADDISEDLVFQQAGSVYGGRGTPDAQGKIKSGVSTQSPDSYAQGSEFQGRYIMLNWWEGDITCDDPARGTWTGSPSTLGAAVSPNSGGSSAPSGEWTLDDFTPESSGVSNGSSQPEGTEGGGGCQTTDSPTAPLAALGFGLFACIGLVRRRRRS